MYTRPPLISRSSRVFSAGCSQGPWNGPVCLSSESQNSKLTLFRPVPRTLFISVYTPLTQGADGSFYLSSIASATGCEKFDGNGSIAKLSLGGTLTTLHYFSGGTSGNNCPGGATPWGRLVQASDGNFYGTTEMGGANYSSCDLGCGTVFRITPSGTFTQLYITFRPTTGGTRSGTLTIADNNDSSLTSTQTVSLSGTGQDFNFSEPSGTTQTVAPGQTATYTVSVGSVGGLNQSASFTCSGEPSESTCAVSPNPATPGSNVTVTITTTAPSATGLRRLYPPPWPRTQFLLILAAPCVGMAWSILARRRAAARGTALLLPLAAGLLLALALSSCGGGGGGGSRRGTVESRYARWNLYAKCDGHDGLRFLCLDP